MTCSGDEAARASAKLAVSIDDQSSEAMAVVFVPSASKQVAIQGGVKRPAIYEVKEQESYADVIKFAGAP